MEACDTDIAPATVKEEDEKSPTEDEKKLTAPVKEEEKADPKIEFTCSNCRLISASCDYYGSRPPFAKRFQTTEDSYIMKDPFCPPPSSGRPNPEYFLIVGVNCAVCELPVCKSAECSFHYGKTFCRECALENVKQFPLEIQTKARKQLSKSSLPPCD